MPVVPIVKAPEMKQALAVLKQADPKALNHVRKAFRSALGSDARGLAAAVPNQPPLSGMATEGRLRWPSSVRGTVSTSTGARRGRDASPLVSIVVSSSDGDAALKMAELAGARNKVWRGTTGEYTTINGVRRRHRVTTQGKSMIRTLNSRFPIGGRAGRFIYNRALKDRSQWIGKAVTALNSFVDGVNRELGG